MKFSIIVVIATLVFAFAAHFLLQDPGYVAINFRGYLVEMSVPVLLGIAVMLVVAVWAIRKIVIAPRLIGEAAGRYRAGRAGQKLTRGMIEVAEGNFARGEKLLARGRELGWRPRQRGQRSIAPRAGERRVRGLWKIAGCSERAVKR